MVFDDPVQSFPNADKTEADLSTGRRKRTGGLQVSVRRTVNELLK